MPESDWESIAGRAGAIARRAGALIRQHTGQRHEVHFKGERDMVTEVDRLVEDFLVDELHSTFPGSRIIAEEGRQATPDSTVDCWYVDPLDGTTNFVHGFPQFCVSLALEHAGDLKAAAIYDPNLDELFLAARGLGATCNGIPASVSQTLKLGKTLLATGFPYRNDASFALNMDLWTTVYGKTQGLRRAGSAALDLAYVATGRLDGFWEFSLEAWDQAAGVLLVQESGGIVSQPDGSPWCATDRNILAGNPAIHESLLNEFGPFSTRIAEL